MGKLESWDCKGCINTEYMINALGIGEYCVPIRDGKHKTDWQGDKVYCLNKCMGKESEENE